ncbi:hypothetical protein J6TS7_66660 [Paenibacillus dendritiformis]|nr:hypothetical protein J6TS7_66660 [Paenibacillus dendritiformis]
MPPEGDDAPRIRRGLLDPVKDGRIFFRAYGLEAKIGEKDVLLH